MEWGNKYLPIRQNLSPGIKTKCRICGWIRKTILNYFKILYTSLGPIAAAQKSIIEVCRPSVSWL